MGSASDCHCTAAHATPASSSCCCKFLMHAILSLFILDSREKEKTGALSNAKVCRSICCPFLFISFQLIWHHTNQEFLTQYHRPSWTPITKVIYMATFTV